MKNLILVAVLLTALPWLQTSAQAPITTNRAEFTLSAGLGLPVGDFGSTTSAEAGGAKLGFNFSGTLTVHVIEFVDVGLHSTVNINGINTDDIEQQLALPVGTLQSGNYVNTGFFGMAGFNTPVTQDIHFYGQAFAGVMWSKSPEVSGSYAGNSFLIPSAMAYPLALGIGTGVRIYSVDLSMKYYTCEPEYDLTIEDQRIKAKQPTSILQLTIGYILPL